MGWSEVVGVVLRVVGIGRKERAEVLFDGWEGFAKALMARVENLEAANADLLGRVTRCESARGRLSQAVGKLHREIKKLKEAAA